MYIVAGAILIAVGVLMMNWARPRAGRPQPRLVQNDTLAGLVVIVVMIFLLGGLTLAAGQFR